MTAFLLCSVDSSLKVSNVIESIENSDDINTVSDRLLNKLFYNVIGIVSVAEDVLTAEKHLKL